MALEFPREMVMQACWSRAELTLMHRQELARSAGGLHQAKDLGEALWQASFESDPMPPAEADSLHADFLTLGGSLRSFLLVPMHRRLPRGLEGSSLSGNIAGISSDRTRLRVNGLVATGKVRRGDYLSIPHPQGGRELHMAAREADVASGATEWFEVVPPLRPSVALGQAASFREPKVEMILTPGSLRKERHALHRWRVRFEAVQVIR